MDKIKMIIGKRSTSTVYHDLASLILITLCILLFFARLFYPQSNLFMIPDFGESDVLHFHLPLKNILSRSLKNGKWPLWTPLIANGFPIFAEGQIGTFFMPNLFLYLFFPLVIAYNLSIILSFIIMATGIYILIRKLNYSAVSSFIAALIYSFSGYFAVQLNHIDVIQTLSLLPYLLLSGYLLFIKPSFKYVLFFSLVLSQQIMAGYINSVFNSLITLLLFLIFLPFYRPLNRFIKRAVFFSLGIIFSLGLGAIQLLPTIELWQNSVKNSGLDFSTVTGFPYPFKHLITFLWPFYFGNPAKGTYPVFSGNWGIFWENTAYMGIIPIIFTILSLFYIKNNKFVRFAFILLLISILLITGKYSPLYFIYSFPPFNFFRIPSKFIIIAVLAITLLNAFIIEKIINKFNRRFFLKFLFISFLLILLMFDTLRFSYKYPPLTNSNVWMQKPESLNFLGGSDKKTVNIGGEIVWDDIFKKEGWQNINKFAFLNNGLFPNYGSLFNIPSLELNMGGLIPKRTAIINSLVMGVPIDIRSKMATPSAIVKNLLFLNGVKYILSPFTISGGNASLIKTIENNNGSSPQSYYVYETKKALAKINFNNNVAFTNTLEDEIKLLSNPDLINNPPTIIEDGSLNINSKPALFNSELFRDDVTEKIIETKSDSAGVLVLSESFYPGWQAYIDGKEMNIYPVNLNQMGILIPNGNHTIKFLFRPDSFEIGKRITLLTWIIVFSGAFLYPLIYSHKSFDKMHGR